MKWISFSIINIALLLIPIVSSSPDLMTKCNAMMTSSSRDFLYSYELSHEGCTLQCTILYPSNPTKYKEYLDSSKVKNYYFNDVPCGHGRICVSGACKGDPRLQPMTTPKPPQVSPFGRIIVWVKNVHFDRSDTCGRSPACDVSVRFEVGKRKGGNTKWIQSTQPEWNEEFNVEFDVRFNETIYFTVLRRKRKTFSRNQNVGIFEVNLQELTSMGKSGRPVLYSLGSSTSFVEVVITWNNKNDHGYFPV